MKYIVNESVMGCERVEITDEKLINDKDQLVYVVLNESTADASCLKTYYNSIKEMLKNNVKVFIVMVAETSKIRGSICNLMQLFGNYNVYQVPDENFISSAYFSLFFLSSSSSMSIPFALSSLINLSILTRSKSPASCAFSISFQSLYFGLTKDISQYPSSFR